MSTARVGAATTLHWWGWPVALISTISFSVAPPVAKAAIGVGLDPTQILLVRFVVSTLLLLFTILLTNPRLIRIDRRGLLTTTGIGLANGLGLLAFFWSLTRLNASIASMIFAIQPVAVLALLALRGERLTVRSGVRVLIGLLGVYLLIGPGGNADLIGVLLVLVAVVAFSVQLVMTQWFLQAYDTRTVTLYVVASITLMIFFWWLAGGPALQNPGRSGWLAIAVLALVSTYLARLTLFLGVRGVGGGQMALLSPLETLFAVLWALLFLDERLSLWQWGGGLLILTSAILAIRRVRLSRWRPPWRLLFKI